MTTKPPSKVCLPRRDNVNVPVEQAIMSRPALNVNDRHREAHGNLLQHSTEGRPTKAGDTLATFSVKLTTHEYDQPSIICCLIQLHTAIVVLYMEVIGKI